MGIIYVDTYQNMPEHAGYETAEFIRDFIRFSSGKT